MEEENIKVENVLMNEDIDNKDETNTLMRKKLDELINTYDDNNNVYSKLQNYILNQLPQILKLST